MVDREKVKMNNNESKIELSEKIDKVKRKKLRFYDVIEELEKSKFSPIKKLIEIAKNENGFFENALSVKATITLVEKTTKTYKSLEHHIDDDQHEQIINSLSSVMNPLLKEHKKDH